MATIVTGAMWTAARAYRRRLRSGPECPYCDLHVVEDEGHVLWVCPAWETVRAPLMPPIVSAACALPRLPNDPDLWPPCLRLCGILPCDLAEGGSDDDQGALVMAVHTMFRAVACVRMQEESNSQRMFDVPRVPPGAYPYRDCLLYTSPSPRD